MDYLKSLRVLVKEQKPLVYCLTNHITINDVANVILAVGAKPIMAEHKEEVEEITKNANSLAINLGNITDDRMYSMMLAGNMARKKNIPCVIDLVGVACSSLRLRFAQNFISKCKPTVLKGNVSELKALDSANICAQGVDVNINDVALSEGKLLVLAQKVSEKYNAIVVITGKVDVIVYENRYFLLNNGHNLMSDITGTGCMLNGLIASFLSTGNFLQGTILATSLISVCGELAGQTAKGTGSFKVDLIDNLYNISDEKFLNLVSIKEQL